MGGRNCCVKNCRRRSHDHHGRKIPNGLTFHCFPAWRTNEGGQISELTRRRRAAWVAAVDRSSISFSRIQSSMRVCSRHFHSGKPAYEMLESDPDWAPSLNLGHGDGNLRRVDRLPLSTMVAAKKQKQKRTLKKRRAEASEAPRMKSEAAEVWVLSLDQHEEETSLSVESKKKSVKRKRMKTRPEETSRDPQPPSEAAEDWAAPLRPDHDEGNSMSMKSKKKPVKRKTSRDPQTPSEAAEDWAASLHLYHDEGNSLTVKSKKKPVKRRKTRPEETSRDPQTPSEAAEGLRKPSVPPWKEVKSVLQSLLQTNTTKKPEDQTFDRPAADVTELSFRDFFRGALEASLEASIRSRARSRSSELTVELNLREDSSSSPPPSSSECSGCVRLQRRLEELEEKLSEVQEETKKTVPQIEEEIPEWSEPASSDQVDQRDGSNPPGRRRRPRFRDEWLSMFWFLRYSPAKDLMWCHVCRLHASANYQKLGLIRGSRVFKLDSIKKHRNTIYHKENLELHMRSSRCPLVSSSS